MTAKPAKLRDGTWGARVQGDVQRGDVITITTKSGQSWAATVERVLWSGDDVSLVATTSNRGTRRGYHGTSSQGEYCYHRCPVGGFVCSPRNGPCHDCE